MTSPTNEILPQGYKMTELGPLPGDWEIVKLGEIAKNRKETVDPNKEDIIYVGLEHINSGDSKLKKYGNSREIKSSKSRFYKDDILYAKLRPYLDKGILAEFEGICSTDILVIKPNKELVNPQYLTSLLHMPNFLDFATKSMTGVNHPRTSWSVLKTFKLPLPPLPEQQKIAAVLSTVQEAKEKTQAVIDATKALKKSMMKHLFTYGPVPPEETENVPLKETEIGEVPEEWEVVKLGENNLLKNTQYGLSVRGEKQGKYPILRMNNLLNGKIVADDLQYIEVDERTFEKFKLKNGDILFNRTNSFELVGKTSLFSLKNDFVFASYLIRLELNEEIISPNFFNFYFNWEVTQSRLKYLATRGVSQSNISATKLKTFSLPLPPLPVQQKIASILSAIDAKIEAEENKKQALEELFKTLLHNLMTAKIRVDKQRFNLKEHEL